MRRFVVLVTFGTALAAVVMLACGPANDKPPLTPDSEHPAAPSDEAGAPATPATPTK